MFENPSHTHTNKWTLWRDCVCVCVIDSPSTWTAPIKSRDPITSRVVHNPASSVAPTLATVSEVGNVTFINLWLLVWLQIVVVGWWVDFYWMLYLSKQHCNWLDGHTQLNEVCVGATWIRDKSYFWTWLGRWGKTQHELLDVVLMWRSDKHIFFSTLWSWSVKIRKKNWRCWSTIHERWSQVTHITYNTEFEQWVMCDVYLWCVMCDVCGCVCVCLAKCWWNVCDCVICCVSIPVSPLLRLLFVTTMSVTWSNSVMHAASDGTFQNPWSMAQLTSV